MHLIYYIHINIIVIIINIQHLHNMHKISTIIQ